MSIKQNGGVFGRNPTFNDVTIEGQLTFDGDIDINSDLKVDGDIETTGDVIIATSGKGIDFSATSGTGTSELFDDYEEGESGALTMTPQTSGTITLNTSYDTFKYTKTGDRVTVSGQFVVSSVSSPVGTRASLPLPFTSASGTSNRAGTAALYYNGSVRTAIPCGVQEGSAVLTIYLDASTIAAGHEFWFDVTYQAA